MGAMRLLVLVTAICWMATSARAKEIAVGGQVRPRMEVRDPVGTGYDTWTSMRVRAHIQARLDKQVEAFIQVQDVRIWGEETHTLGDYNADNFDLHQGYVTLRQSSMSVRVGRQAISLGGQRLIGAVDWAQQGRAFDGVRATFAPHWGTVDVLGIRLWDATAPRLNTNAYLTGIYATIKRPAGGLDVYGLYNRISAPTPAFTGQYTIGARWAGKAGGVDHRIEGSYQTGKRFGLDVSAFMVGARAGVPVGRGRVALWYDYLSGDDAPTDGKVKVFDTLFATNHKFYGYADVFTDIPAHTGGAGLGLQNAAIKLSYPLGKGVALDVDGHVFWLAKQGMASTKHLANEVDVTLSYRYSTEVTLVGGASYVFAKQALVDIGRLRDDLKFAYVMMNVAF